MGKTAYQLLDDVIAGKAIQMVMSPDEFFQVVRQWNEANGTTFRFAYLAIPNKAGWYHPKQIVQVWTFADRMTMVSPAWIDQRNFRPEGS